MDDSKSSMSFDSPTDLEQDNSREIAEEETKSDEPSNVPSAGFMREFQVNYMQYLQAKHQVRIPEIYVYSYLSSYMQLLRRVFRPSSMMLIWQTNDCQNIDANEYNIFRPYKL